jgi:hypothetical protein
LSSISGSRNAQLQQIAFIPIAATLWVSAIESPINITWA